MWTKFGPGSLSPTSPSRNEAYCASLLRTDGNVIYPRHADSCRHLQPDRGPYKCYLEGKRVPTGRKCSINLGTLESSSFLCRLRRFAHGLRQNRTCVKQMLPGLETCLKWATTEACIREVLSVLAGARASLDGNIGLARRGGPKHLVTGIRPRCVVHSAARVAEASGRLLGISEASYRSLT